MESGASEPGDASPGHDGRRAGLRSVTDPIPSLATGLPMNDDSIISDPMPNVCGVGGIYVT